MSPLGPILAVTDFSAPARHAADRAARLAHETASALTLLRTPFAKGLVREGSSPNKSEVIAF